jgi:hypothetical protein
MGFPKFWSKKYWATWAAGQAGEAFKDAPPGRVASVYHWCLRHKKEIGGLFSAIYGWALVTGCPEVYGVNVIGYLHLSCENVKDVIGLLGAGLMSAGLMDSDTIARQKQVATGKIADPRLEPRIPGEAVIVPVPGVPVAPDNKPEPAPAPEKKP